jgi:TM2 domain-containing membrane protein YozV
MNDYVNPYQDQSYEQPQQYGQPRNLPQSYQPSAQYEQPGPDSQYTPPQPPPPPNYAPPPPQQQWQRPYQQPVQVAPRSPALGLIVSIFIPGVGSMMAGQTGKGVGILAGYLVGWLLCFVLIGFVVMPAFWIWGLVAAYMDAVAWNRAHGIIS